MSDVTIRRATDDDIPAIRSVAERGWNAAYEEILPQSVIDERIEDWYDRDMLAAILAREDLGYFVAERDGAVVGYASARPADDDPDLGRLPSIYVDPDHWDEGIGTTLLETAEEFLREAGCAAIRVVTLAENRIATGFYESHGYVRSEVQSSEMGERPVAEYVYLGEL